QRIGVHHVPAWPASLRRAGLVVSGCLRFLGIRRDLSYSVRKAREFSKQVSQLRIGALGNIAVGTHQTIRVGIVKFRVRAEIFAEIGKSSPESNSLDEHVHFLPDPLYFG